MAAPKGNNFGKQFSEKYQPPEKWTEEKALGMGEDLIKWLKETDEDGDDKGNTLFEEFLYLKNDYHPKTISYLAKKFKSFFTLLEIAKKIQELKIHKYGLGDRFNVQMSKFSLINNHGWKDKSTIEQENTHKFEGDVFSKIRENSGISNDSDEKTESST